MTRALLAFCCLAALVAPPHAGARADAGEEVFGPADCTAATGNGSLTACVNGYGRISGCRWPSPGYNDQISYCTRSRDLPALGVAPEDGVMWGLRLDGETRWLIGPPWRAEQHYRTALSPVIETVCTWPDSPIKVTQTLLIPSEANVLVARLTIEGASQAPEVFWYANFTPCTRLIPEIPIADWALDSANDFAAFAEGGARDSRLNLWHFRPHAPGSPEWSLARKLAQRNAAAPDWFAFGEGVWIASTSSEPVAGFQCGTQATEASAFAQAASGALANQRAAVGPCDSALALQPARTDGAFAATVFTAFGKEPADAARALVAATRKGYDALLADTEAHWGKWLQDTSVGYNEDPEIPALEQRCLLTLATAMDLYSGAVVRAPIGQPPLALDYPQDGVWITLALDAARLQTLAERHLLFYTGALRPKSLPGKPAGSLPSALYANQFEAAPGLVLDVEAAGYTLWSLGQHATFLDPQARSAYLDNVRDATDALSDFLVSWVDTNTGEPPYSFDWALLRDARSPQSLLATYLGLTSSSGIARTLRLDRPEWEKRKNELQSLLRSASLDSTGNWRIEDPLPFWPAGVVPADSPLWDAAAKRAIEALASQTGLTAARTLYNLTMILRQPPEKLAQLKPILKPTVKRALGIAEDALITGAAFPDALAAAFCFMAIQNVAVIR